MQHPKLAEMVIDGPHSCLVISGLTKPQLPKTPLCFPVVPVKTDKSLAEGIRIEMEDSPGYKNTPTRRWMCRVEKCVNTSTPQTVLFYWWQTFEEEEDEYRFLIDFVY